MICSVIFLPKGRKCPFLCIGYAIFIGGLNSDFFMDKQEGTLWIE